eukprot:TRINITY_DN12094_c0_g1_i10.p1 TRINITY_DN12094_c0_g1~~TRINITY_DN12094_c0_g1_i10.p1  ORF type:complete len:416 (+),score=37.09 TRINITY_DN12094_c0_g1_i10:179-1426(+)
MLSHMLVAACLGTANVYDANTACCVCGGGLGLNETNVPATPAPPTPVPPTYTPHDPQCEDRLLPGGEDWHMSWGSSYNCTWFRRYPRCRWYGNHTNVYDANTACCVCGGGLGRDMTDVPATPGPRTDTPPTLAPAVPSTFTPYGPQCEDRLLPGGDEWHMPWGREYTCAWFTRFPYLCNPYGRLINVYDGNTACCVCGGGLGLNETNVPATPAPPTPVPPTFTPFDPQCEDRLLPGGDEWHMPWGREYTCAWFTRFPYLCNPYGRLINVYDGNTACCVCGGGLGLNETNVPATPAPPTPVPPTFTPFDPQCEDRLLPGGEDWHMSWGSYYNCTWFALSSHYCSWYGSHTNVYDANTACCVCGGGLGVNETNIPATPAPPTPVPPTFTPFQRDERPCNTRTANSCASHLHAARPSV